jgi:hypothetical protein
MESAPEPCVSAPKPLNHRPLNWCVATKSQRTPSAAVARGKPARPLLCLAVQLPRTRCSCRTHGQPARSHVHQARWPRGCPGRGGRPRSRVPSRHARPGAKTAAGAERETDRPRQPNAGRPASGLCSSSSCLAAHSTPRLAPTSQRVG